MPHGLHHLVPVFVAFGDRAFVLADLEAVGLALVSGEQAGAHVPAVVGGPGQLLPLRVDGVEVGEWGAARGEQVGFEGLDAAGQPLEGLIRVLDVAAYVVVQFGEVVADGAKVVLEAADAAPDVAQLVVEVFDLP